MESQQDSPDLQMPAPMPGLSQLFNLWKELAHKSKIMFVVICDSVWRHLMDNQSVAHWCKAQIAVRIML